MKENNITSSLDSKDKSEGAEEPETKENDASETTEENPQADSESTETPDETEPKEETNGSGTEKDTINKEEPVDL